MLHWVPYVYICIQILSNVLWFLWSSSHLQIVSFKVSLTTSPTSQASPYKMQLAHETRKFVFSKNHCISTSLFGSFWVVSKKWAPSPIDQTLVSWLNVTWSNVWYPYVIECTRNPQKFWLVFLKKISKNTGFKELWHL